MRQRRYWTLSINLDSTKDFISNGINHFLMFLASQELCQQIDPATFATEKAGFLGEDHTNLKNAR